MISTLSRIACCAGWLAVCLHPAAAADLDGSRDAYSWNESRYGGPGSWSAARYGGAGSWSASRYGGPGSWSASRYGGQGSWNSKRFGGTSQYESNNNSGRWGGFGQNPSAGWSGESAQEHTRSELLREAIARHALERTQGGAANANIPTSYIPNYNTSNSDRAAQQLGNEVRNTFTGILRHEWQGMTGAAGQMFSQNRP